MIHFELQLEIDTLDQKLRGKWQPLNKTVSAAPIDILADITLQGALCTSQKITEIAADLRLGDKALAADILNHHYILKIVLLRSMASLKLSVILLCPISDNNPAPFNSNTT